MYNRRLVFWAACLGMLMFGIVMTTLGAILPSVFEKFAVSKANAGSLMLLMSFGILLGSIIFGPIIDRYGYKTLLIVCGGLVFLGLEGIAFASNFNWLRVFVFLIGFGGGVINGGTNALVADISEQGKTANLSLLGMFFGVGAIGIPLILGALSGLFDYMFIIASIGGFVLAILVYYFWLTFPVPKQEQGFPLKEGAGLLKETALLLFGFILFFQSGMEITVGSWTSTFFKEVLNLNAGKAVLFFSFYWLGIVIARLLLGSVLKKIKPSLAEYVSILIALIGAIVMIISHRVMLSIAGLFLVGLGFAAGYPVMLGYVGKLYEKLSGTAFSIVFVIALIGGMLFPYATGFLGENFGLRSSFIFIPVSLCCIAVLFTVVLNRIPKTND